MKGKKIISAFLAAFLFSSVCSSTLANAVVTDSSQTASTEEKTLIYRKSVKGKGEGVSIESGKWEFIYALTAYSNGLIHIDIQCDLSRLGYTCNKIGDIIFDDSMIASIDEKGYAGVSSFKPKNANAKYTTSFSDTGIVYSSIYSDSSNSLSGETLMSFDLYVKEKYLTTNQQMNLFGTEIEIPFGNPPIDKDAKIEELESKVTELETNLKDIQNTIARLDANNDGTVNSVDASIILWIYAYNSTNSTPIETFDQYNELKK